MVLKKDIKRGIEVERQAARLKDGWDCGVTRMKEAKMGRDPRNSEVGEVCWAGGMLSLHERRFWRWG